MSPAVVAVTGRPLSAGRIQGWVRDATGIQRAYLDAVRRAGGLPAVVDPVELDADAARSFVRSFDAIILTGGPDVDPTLYGEERDASVYGVDATADAFEIALCRAAVQTGTALLAICRGLQVVNVAMGGTLIQHLPNLDELETHGRPGMAGGEMLHEVVVTEGSLLGEVLGATRARCSCHHHQAVARPGAQVTVSAVAVDGVVEGIEVEGAWLLAVQWHPEDTAGTDPTQQRLFDALVGRALAARDSAG